MAVAAACEHEAATALRGLDVPEAGAIRFANVHQAAPLAAHVDVDLLLPVLAADAGTGRHCALPAPTVCSLNL